MTDTADTIIGDLPMDRPAGRDRSLPNASEELDVYGFPREAERPRPGRGDLREHRRPGFLAAPFSARTWRESLHLLLNLPLGIVTFTYGVTMFTLGLGLVVTFVGMPLLAALVLGCRGFGAMERARARAGLGVDLPAPAAPQPARPGLMGWISAQLRSGTGWRATLYSVLLLPLGVVSFSVTLTMWTVGIGCGTYPLWQWVFPAFTDRPGLRLFDNNGHTFYLSSVPQIAGVCGVGLVFLFLAPPVVRGLAGLQRSLVRGLLH